jgi:DNA-binding MarR family transcriptional regulator
VCQLFSGKSQDMATSTKPATSQGFYLALVEFLLQAKHQVIAISGEFGLTSMQALTLLMTDNKRPKSMNSFCKMYDCDASNITGIIDGLEQKGLVSRREHPSDRRVKIVYLEEDGATLQQTIIKRLAEDSGFLFKGLDDSEAHQLITIMTKLARSQPA